MAKVISTEYIPELDDYELPRELDLDPRKAKPNRFAELVNPTGTKAQPRQKKSASSTSKSNVEQSG